jgi:hypothetical protein
MMPHHATTLDELFALRDENKRLRAERDQYLKSSVDYGNLSERLRAALEPFAVIGRKLNEVDKATIPDGVSAHYLKLDGLFADDFRRAALTTSQRAEK